VRVDGIPGEPNRRREPVDDVAEAIYVFDYGAPVGFRLATRHPERITAIVSQNGNAYEQGLSEGWNPIQRYWEGAQRREPRGAPHVPDARGD
jgi:pimeloyl-ACP methyl ester carboxylesterase